MVMMLLGLALFVATHVVTSLRGLRSDLIARLGEGAYKGFYSLLAASGLLLTAYGYELWRAAGPALIWNPPHAMRHLAMLLLLLAAIAAVAAYVPSHIRAVLKHPLLVAVKTWALAHLLVNGDAASMVLFGVILAWAVYDRIALKKRGAPLPVAPKGWGGDALALGLGLVLFLALAYLFHPYIIGVPVMG
ncbi:NnrU family protein [Xanthobacter tagetidis]|uniref:NnrU family protein n=1 Tax=Xanthobacter tagetidis TaxID=60216 RepID=A0A3L7AMZ9_9HYPH|nr:NnrU family protein [Xanthobacter tagetidis]MBB6308214.1 putative membrane protein [Xanthobacter tagetidis]RLP81829.1 NnrU family protein [Xanthobacter tagetidis]